MIWPVLCMRRNLMCHQTQNGKPPKERPRTAVMVALGPEIFYADRRHGCLQILVADRSETVYAPDQHRRRRSN